jgi:uncharacterized protein (DUF4213/DUF364 family)
MGLKNEFRKMITGLTAKFAIPPIESVFLPPFCRVMAISLEGGATGISYVLVPDARMEEYTALQREDFSGRDPQDFALEFGGANPVAQMLGLASINAICQHVMRDTNFTLDSATDSLGLLSISAGDRVGMVGLFSRLIETVMKAGAELVVIERKEQSIRKYPDLPITQDVTELGTCNKVLSTSTTVLNNSLEEILASCSPDAFISIVGPTAGYFPDPLFALGVDVVGGRVVDNGEVLLQLLEERRRWGDATHRICFQRETYVSII